MKRVLLISILFIMSCGSDIQRSVQTYQVKKSSFHVNVVESGEVQAVNSIAISSPPLSFRFGQLTITQIIDDGAEISEGDTAIIFDPSEVQKSIIDANSELEIAKAELNKLRAEQESKIQELEADLKVAEISHQISEIELSFAKFESDMAKKKIQLNLDQSKIQLNKASDEIENYKNIHREQRYQAQLKIKQLENNLEEANNIVQSLTVVSQSSGVAIIRKNWGTGNKWQVGDTPWSGMPMIDLPDLRELKAETEINEVDISKIKKDQEVEIQLDAFSDTIYTGRVVEIASLAKFKDEEEKSKVKIFPVTILINGTSKSMMPGMTVSCKIIVDKIENVLFVPLEAISREENKDFVFLKSGGSFNREEVKVGLANNDYIIIETGLEEGDRVALSNPYLEEEKIENSDES